MSPNSSNVFKETASGGNNAEITQPSVSASDGSPQSGRSQQRRGRQQSPEDQLNRFQATRREIASSGDSHEIRWSRHVTRDSMISGMLQSLNSQGSQTNRSRSNSVKRSNEFPPSSFPRAIAALNSHHSNSPSNTSAESYPSTVDDDRQRPSPRKLGRPKPATKFNADSSQSSAESPGSPKSPKPKNTSRPVEPLPSNPQRNGDIKHGFNPSQLRGARWAPGRQDRRRVRFRPAQSFQKKVSL